MKSSDFERFLARYGQCVSVHYRDEPVGVAAHAFLQPLREKNKAQELPSPLGLAWHDRFLYLGDPGVPLDGLGEGFVECRGERYDVVSAQPVYLGGELSHWWGVLLPRDGEEPT